MPALPTISQWEVFRNRREILKNPLPFHRRNFDQLGDTFVVRVGRKKEVVFTRDAGSIEHILRKHHKNYYKSDLQSNDLAKYVGNGILTSNGDFWRVHRRMVQPAFHKKKLEGLLRIMYLAIKGELEKLLPGPEVDIFPIMGDLAFQVVAQSLFSTEELRAKMRKLQYITETNQKMLIREMRQPYLKWWFQLSGKINRHLQYSEDARKLLNGIIEERVNSGLEKDDLLDMLLRARYEDGTPMPRRQLIDEVLILFTAGHETTANALSFTLFLLAEHPEVQEGIYREAIDLDFEKGDLLQILAGLGYTQQCIEEAMRLYPPVYVIDRVSLKKDEVEGHAFEKNTVWLMSIYELHRLTDFWRDPEKFDPGRFSPENRRDHSAHYYPFGAGPRMCVGNNFAMYEMIMTVAILIRKFKWHTPGERLSLNPLISLKPEKVLLRFSER